MGPSLHSLEALGPLPERQPDLLNSRTILVSMEEEEKQTSSSRDFSAAAGEAGQPEVAVGV